MHLPGIITMSPDNVGLIDRVGTFMGDSFLEELWTARYLDALGGEESEARKREVSRKMLREEFAVASRYECAYTLPDEAGAALGFLGSELAKTGKTWMEIEEEAHEPLAGLLDADARAAAGHSDADIGIRAHDALGRLFHDRNMRGAARDIDLALLPLENVQR